ncbi:bifunctional diaminohydroxyphosphoribosylaminopyrimidine deaminase/5-amino-6-(5-phosphoribosylamino)uracil reductase RibD [Niabella insulamsoli]|uniref:bifunctional diaminohydroxyphosphoribosylaminopyrimidine deaminase/5-amino-6-(5-phosphoribosylamino)uracil reductase RibD n=1 Tax=Niabella insulamsoli TaxID=3144874 RepID=UPI0031FBC35C
MQGANHEKYMQRCLQLARMAVGEVAPNPMVGAVLVYQSNIIGEGYHQHYGGPHAEVHCINDALKSHAEKIAHSTLYVSLEPCAHFGKTPPCANLIIKHQIPDVVIGCRDSFDQVDGRGIERLRKAGVKVTVGVLEKESLELNKAFFTFHQQKRPYVVLKWAQTEDRFMAGTGSERLLISNEYSKRLVHQWRSASSAILIGAQTAINDDPLLDNRHWFGKAPQKVIFDPLLKVPSMLKLFQTGDVVIVLNTEKDAVSKNVIYVKMDKADMVPDAMRQLHQLNIQSIFVEGGQKVLQAFMEADLWDEAFVITNKDQILGTGLTAPVLKNQRKLHRQMLFNDEIIHFKNQNNSFIDAGSSLF